MGYHKDRILVRRKAFLLSQIPMLLYSVQPFVLQSFLTYFLTVSAFVPISNSSFLGYYYPREQLSLCYMKPRLRVIRLYLQNVIYMESFPSFHESTVHQTPRWYSFLLRMFISERDFPFVPYSGPCNSIHFPSSNLLVCT